MSHFNYNKLRMTKTEILIDRNIISPDWAEAIPEAFTYFYDNIAPEIKTKAQKAPVYPEALSIFRAFKECSEDKVKVVIIGQDPYHDGSAIGVCFDNPVKSKKVSPSLRNILIELESDLNGYLEGIKRKVSSSYLEHLPAQGVLLLNTALSVEHGKPNSHSELWAPFTKQIIEHLNTKNDIIWVMWGNYAKSYKKVITNTTHHFIEGAHPSPLSANRAGFFGGKYFSKTNEILKSLKKKEIVW